MIEEIDRIGAVSRTIDASSSVDALDGDGSALAKFARLSVTF